MFAGWYSACGSERMISVLEHGRVGTAGDLREHLREARGLRSPAISSVHAAHREEALQLLDAVLVGLAVDADTAPAGAVLLQEAGGLHVGRDHAFLDQPMRVVARVRADVRRTGPRRRPAP